MTATTPATLEDQRALLEQRFPQRVVTLPSGARVAVRERGVSGAATPIVLLHGISSGAASWLHAVLPLPQQQHVIAWDAPGYGDSTPLSQAAPTGADYAQRLQELLQVLQVQRCVLVGHSLGAIMASAYAARSKAGAVSRLVLLSPARGYGAAGQEQQRDRVRKERGDALRTLGVAGLAARIDQRLLSAAASDSAREWVRWNTSRLDADGYLQAVELLAGSAPEPIPAGIAIEVHCGEDDVVTTPQACAQLAQALGAPFSTIANAGHASPVEQPEAVARLLARAAS